MVADRANYTNIATNATTVIASTAGSLCRITVNKVGTTSTATVYDNSAASGTIIATLSTVAVGTLHYMCRYSTGLTIVTAGAAAADITVTWE
jgi:hypothetical protein